MVHEDLTEALVACVKACGGSKQVGPLLWPEVAPDAAQRKLLDCLNPERPAHLQPDQVLYLLKLARQRGFHEGFGYMAQVLGYAAPLPVDPVDEVAELQRQYVQAARDLMAMNDRILSLQERIDGTGKLRAVG